MKKTLVYTAVGILIFILGYQTGHFVTKKNCDRKLEEVVNIYTSSDISAEDNDGTSGSIFDGLDISGDTLLDCTGKTVAVSSLPGGKCIYAEYSNTGCRPCIDFLTAQLREFAAQNPDWHISLIVDAIPVRDLYVLSKEFGPSFTLYSSERLETDLGSEVSPVMFRLDKNGKVFRHFTCSPDDHGRTADYISHITL